MLSNSGYFMDVCYTVHINYITCMISNGGLLFLMCGHFYHGFLIVNFFGQPPPTFLVAAAYGAHLTSSPQDKTLPILEIRTCT